MPLTLLLSLRCPVAYLQLQSDVLFASLLTSPPERLSLSGCHKVMCIAPHVQPDRVNGRGDAGFGITGCQLLMLLSLTQVC